MSDVVEAVKETVKKATKKAPAKPKIVKMIRGEQTADVHPDMVEEYKKGNWAEA